MNQYAKDNAVWTGLAALFMMFYGWFGGAWIYPASADALYILLFDVFDWMLKIGGGCLAIVAIVCFLGHRLGLLLDAIFSGICGLILAGCPAYWMLKGSVGFQNILFIVLGIFLVREACRSWSAYGSSSHETKRESGEGRWFGIPTLEPPRAQKPSIPEPPHPASLKSDALPKDGEPPPEEGYLAALAKEKDEPPSASYE